MSVIAKRKARGTAQRKGLGYAEIAENFRRRIDSGDLLPGDVIPTIPELMQETGSARATVSRAVALLQDEGYLTPGQGFEGRVHVNLGGPARKYAVLLDALNSLEADGEDLQVPGRRLTGRSSGITWNAKTKRWEITQEEDAA